MTPFLQFRLWLRHGPRAERGAAGVAGLIFVLLVAWAVVPLNDEPAGNEQANAANASRSRTTDQREAQTGGSDAAGAPTTAAAEQATDGSSAAEAGQPASTPEVQETEPSSGQDTGGGTDTGGSTGNAQTGQSGQPDDPSPKDGATSQSEPEAGDRCPSELQSTDQGVSPTNVFVAVTLLNLAGDTGNRAFGVRGPDDMKKVAHAAAEAINREGGVACRKMRVKTYRVNPANREDQRAKCLEIVEDKPFSVMDFGGYLDPAARSCFPDNNLPYTGLQPLSKKELNAWYPLMYNENPSINRAFRNWVFEAASRGWFETDEFEKLGLFLKGCNPEANQELKDSLTAVGISEEQRSTVTAACREFTPPSEITQAVVQHRQDEASHVFLGVSISDAQSYVREADRIQYVPGYLVSDFGSNTAGGETAEGWSDGYDGAKAITSGTSGEWASDIENPLRSDCQEWYEGTDTRPPEGPADIAFSFCDKYRLFQAMTNRIEPNNVMRTNLIPGGLGGVDRFQFVGQLDALFDPPDDITGGDFIRPIQFQLDCHCWKVLDRELSPGH